MWREKIRQWAEIDCEIDFSGSFSRARDRVAMSRSLRRHRGPTGMKTIGAIPRSIAKTFIFKCFWTSHLDRVDRDSTGTKSSRQRRRLRRLVLLLTKILWFSSPEIHLSRRQASPLSCFQPVGFQLAKSGGLVRVARCRFWRSTAHCGSALDGILWQLF